MCQKVVFEKRPIKLNIHLSMVQVLVSPASNTGSGLVNGLEVLGGGLRSMKGESVGLYAIPFEVGARQLEVDLIAIFTDVGDLEDGIGARSGHFVHDLGHHCRL
jgi:hypothetical protein